MWLAVPEAEEHTLWEGALEAEAAEAERMQRSLGDKSTDRVIRDLPIVSIGRPDTWPLVDVYPQDQMSPALQSKVRDANFFLVRLSCSFRPRADGPQVEWARFQVSLLPDQAGNSAVAFDLHPLQVTNEVKRNTKVTLSPTVKFLEVAAGAGELEFGFEYTQIEPIISATGAGESSPSWDYQAVRGIRLQGSKWMHLLVEAPLGMSVGFATIGLTADVFDQGFRLPVFAKPRVATADPLTIELWRL